MTQPNDSDKPSSAQPLEIVHLPRPRPSLTTWISRMIVETMIEEKATQEAAKVGQSEKEGTIEGN